ncbi:MAG: TIGR02302 family protein [Alphaproteobacteria bacterium]|nr:MAG: TIGR02302 family protein [Alphaproteobacteria bacterium]
MRQRIKTGETGYGLIFELRLVAARINLLIEDVWRRGRILFLALGLFFALSLLDVWRDVGPVLHNIGLLLFAGASLYGLYRLVKNFHFPNRQRALRYLEARNSLAHRPLRSLEAESELGNDSETSSVLWRRYQLSLRGKLRGLRIGLPRLDMGIDDGFALRALIILPLVIGIIVAGPKAANRLDYAFTPKFGAGGIKTEVTAWITPPAYTRKPPILLRADKDGEAGEKLSVPVGSKFIAHVMSGDKELPVLFKGKEELPFKALNPRNFEVETDFTVSGPVRIEQDGDLLRKWQLEVVADLSPTVTLTADPEVTARAAFKLQYEATDDYGVQKIEGEITRAGDDKKITLSLPASGRGGKKITGKSFHDLTAHPWAGLPVLLTLTAEDQAGQKGQSKPVSFTLPERTFNEPLARALIEQRKNLVRDPKANRAKAMFALDAFSQMPEAAKNDYTVMLALSFAHSLLTGDGGEEAVDEVVKILWDTALRIENGDLSQAEAELRAAEQALMEALNNNASDSEIKKRVEELRAAMDKFLQALAEQSKNSEMAAENPNSDNQLVNQQDLQKLLDRVDQFARNGARDAARQLLSQLQDIMENLKAMNGQPQSAGQQQAQKMLNDLSRLMDQQQKLLDQTLQENNRQNGDGQQGNQQSENGQQQGQGQPGQRQSGSGQPGEGGSYSGLAKNQEAIRQLLGDLMGRLGMQGEIPQGLGRAERSMNEARKALEGGDGQSAMTSEGEALENLRQGAESLTQQMMSRGQGPGMGARSAGPGMPGEGRDPLGRPTGEETGDGGIAGGDMRMGGQNFNKSRAIRGEVERRLFDTGRSPLERNYLNRLIDIF